VAEATVGSSRAEGALEGWTRAVESGDESAVYSAGAVLFSVLQGVTAPPPPAPEMRIVTGLPRFADPRATDGDPEEYDGKPLEGLQCPYEDCGVVNWQGFDTEIRVEDGTWISLGVRVVDRGERWSAFRYDRGWVEEHEIRVVDGRRRWVGSGQQVEHRCIVGSYGDTPDMHTVRYECEACDRPVSLPADVSEDGQ
jgi:hypothetical protein